MDVSEFAETWDAKARAVWKDEPLRYDFRDGLIIQLRGTFAMGETMIDEGPLQRRIYVQQPSIWVSRADFVVAGTFHQPKPGHRVKRFNTGEIFEVMHRTDDNLYRPHGTYNKELRIFLEWIAA